MVTKMHGRRIIKTPIPEDKSGIDSKILDCADCNGVSRFIITELVAPKAPFLQVWGWCGKCDIGG